MSLLFPGHVSPSKVKQSMPMSVVACSLRHRQRFPYFLGELSPRKVVKSMWMLVAASTHRHRHRFPYFFWAMRHPEESGNLCGCLWMWAATHVGSKPMPVAAGSRRHRHGLRYFFGATRHAEKKGRPFAAACSRRQPRAST